MNIDIWKKRLKKIKIILFDWDGTLNRDDLKHYVAKNDVIRKFKLKNIGLNRIKYHNFEGITSEKLNGSHARKAGWQYFKHVYSNEINLFKRLFIYLYYELAYNLNSSCYDFLIPNSAKTLRILKDKGYILAVATNKGSNIVNKQLKISNIKGIFSSNLGSDKVLKMKPNPEMILKNLSIINRKMKTKFKVENILMVGDSVESDIGAGLNAGCLTCLVNNNESLDKYPENELPHLNLKSINELPKFL